MKYVLTLLFLAAPFFAHAQGTGYQPYGSATTPYGLNSVSPSAGITQPGGTATPVSPSSSQFSPSGTNTLYGNYGNDYRPELPTNVYGQAPLPPVSEEQTQPEQTPQAE